MAAIAAARRGASSREEEGGGAAQEEHGRRSSSPAQTARSSASSPRGNVLPSHHSNGKRYDRSGGGGGGDDDDEEEAAAAAAAEAAAMAAATGGGGERASADLVASGFEPPPFTLSEIRAVIPKKCWEKDVWRSLTFLLRDVAAVVALACSAISFAPRAPWMLWPVYWFAQGTMFWSLFVLGHDCGHGSFSNSKKLNDFIGHLTHSFILVPYHGWRISHRTHHANHGHVERDESWHPLPEKLYRSLSAQTRITRFSLLSMFVYPLYLWGRSPGKEGSHFDPKSPLFAPRERTDVLTSTSCWLAMVLVLFIMLYAMGPMWIFKVYVVPYWVFVVWLDAVTYLHHHGHNEKVPWYRGQEWSYTRGGLSTIDRDYGWFNKVHHDIGTHVVHHLFPQIPHYHLVEATEAIKPVLGKYYREPEKSGPFPTHLWKVLVKSISEDNYVNDTGDVVFYQTDKKSKQA